MAKKNTSDYFQNILKPIFTFFHIFFCFCVVYLLLAVLIVPIVLTLCFRLIISLVFKIVYKGKYKLFQAENGIHAPDFYASVYTIYAWIYIGGPCDINIARERIFRVFTERTKNGDRPYERMFCKVVKKFGFFCWENAKSEFDITHHIRPFPGWSDPNRIYSEKEIFEAAASIADKTWDDSRPRWELLVVPQVKREDSDEICSVVHFRFQHAYGDGVSIVQMLLNCFGDQPPAKFIYDPVIAPGKRPPFYFKLFSYLQVFLMGPWIAMRFASHKERHIFYEGPLKGGKLMGRNTFPVPVSLMRDIRKHYKVSTTAIQHYALTGALQKYARRRGLPIPKEILGSIVTVLMPYPSIYPQNRIMMFLEQFPVGERDPLQRLFKINEISKRTWSPTSYYIALTSRVINILTGILPAGIIEKLVVLIQLSYCVSNVPGVKDTSTFNGFPVRNVISTGPLLNGFRFVIGIGCYDDHFTFGFQSEKCKLIRNRDDLCELIRDFEDEIKFLKDNMKMERV